MQANNTNSANTLACNTGITDYVVPNSKVDVLVNGVNVNIGNNVSNSCYFSPDNIIIRNNGNVQQGDYLYWNYDISGNTVAGYELDSTDHITFCYITH